jgi:hypothetical protein
MEFSRRVPIGRIARPEEIAEAALYSPRTKRLT